VYNIPKVLRRGGVAFVAIWVFYWFLMVSPWKQAFTQRGWVYAMWVLVVAVVAWTGFRVNRIRRKVKAADGLLCLECLYCLRGLEPCGKCPECGTPYDISVVVPTWARALRNAGF